MDEPLVRLAVVAVAAVMVVGFALFRKRRSTLDTRRIEHPGLSPGVYLFSSDTCVDCQTARRALESQVGSDYTEISWESDRERFDELGIRDVPSTLVVGEDGSGLWFPGVPRRRLNPDNP